MKAISIRQPWAWLIVHGYKDVENRTWATKYRGPILIHAGKTLDPGFDELCQVLREEFDIHVPLRKELPRGGIVGQVTATSGSGFSICECAALSNHIVAWANSAIAQGAKIYYTLGDQEWC